MSILFSSDRGSYRRWVNILPSAVIPGAGQYLSGRRGAGLLWLICYVAYVGAKFVIKFSPFVKSPTLEAALPVGDGIFLICVCLDACRRPVLRLGFKRWLAFVAFAAAFFLLPILCLRQFFLHPFSVPTVGMQPTLMGRRTAPDGHEERGDSFVVDKFTYRVSEPQRGDIVAFKTAGLHAQGLSQNGLLVKRIVGLPGEKVSIRPPFLYINGSRLVTPKVFERINAGSDGFSGYVGAGRLSSDVNEVSLGHDQYLVLGDNSQNSLDGRYFGPISRKSIIGKVAWISAPPARKRWVE